MPTFDADLLSGEQVVSIRTIDQDRTPHHPDALTALVRLARVKRPGDVGRNGPLLAAIAESNVTDEELRKFEVVFGRDSLVSALSVADRFPALLDSTLQFLAHHQGRKLDSAKAEEPGKIPHEIRPPDDQVAKRLTAEHGWGWPYYGSIDATALFLIGCGRHADSHPTPLDAGYVQALRAAALWLLDKLSDSPGRFLESSTPASGGLLNQTWKDSWDAYATCSGAVIGPPLASIEVQALAFDGARAAAALLAGSSPKLSAALREAASSLRESVLATFWIDKAGRFGLGAFRRSGSDGYQLLEPLASNMGRLLDSAILVGPEAAEFRGPTIEALFSKELLCAGGLRTLGSEEARYRPSSYHNGSSWPWDTAAVARGLRRHGFTRLAAALEQRVIAVCEEFGGFPEFCRGESNKICFNDRIVDVRDALGRSNRIEQPPQQTVAWTVTAVLAIESAQVPPVIKLAPADRRLEAEILDSI